MVADSLVLIAPIISLTLGLFFFLFAARYYIFVGLILSGGSQNTNVNRDGSVNGNGNGNGNGNNAEGKRNGLNHRYGFLSRFAKNSAHYNANGNNRNNSNNHRNNNNNRYRYEFLSHFDRNGDNNNQGSNNNEKGKEGQNRINNRSYPFVSIHLPFYNEKNVALRILDACVNLDYPKFEIVVVDDSTDGTFEAIRKWARYPKPVNVKIIHRIKRSGFKGGALNTALEYIDPRAEYVVVFDADFIPSPDIIEQFLACFAANFQNHNNNNNNNNHRNNNNNKGFRSSFLSRFNGGRNNHGFNGGTNNHEELLKAVEEYYKLREVAVVQGYQLHNLNAGENWITRGVRAEYSGSYMVERSCQEILGAMKMISGSVYMIKADVLKKYRWSTSLTEDWELTLRLYADGYKVLYTPLIAAPAEVPSTLGRLIKQRMRWAEGHTFNVKHYFWGVMKSRRLSIREKVEFLYYAPYYLQSLTFIVGTSFWFISEAFRSYIPLWTATFGWALVLSNLISLPLMGLTGLFLERSAQRDWKGVLSFILLSYILTPYMALAALKGLFEKSEGTWVRTFKTGLITEKIIPLQIRKIGRWFRRAGRKRTAEKKAGTNWFSPLPSLLLVAMTAATLGISLLGATIAPVRAQTLADNTWYLTDESLGTGLYKMYDGTTSGTEASLALSTATTHTWYSHWAYPYTGGQSMSGTWTLTIRVKLNTFATSPKYMTCKVGYSSSSGGTFNDLSSGGTQVDIVGWTADNSYNVSISVSGTLPDNNYVALQLVLPTQAGKKLTIYLNQNTINSRLAFPGTLVPENGLFLLLVAPIIPIAFSRAKNNERD